MWPSFPPPPPPWTVSRHIWQTALQPDVSGVAVDARLFHEAGCRLVHRYRVYKDPFPHPALREGVIPRLLSCVCRAMVIARLTHLRIYIPASGVPPGHVPDDCFPGGAPRKDRPGLLRVSFADNVTMLGVMPPSMCSPVLEVIINDVVIPEGKTNGPSDVVLDVIPPPPGFSPFSWPIVSEHVAIKQSGSPLGDGGSPDVLVSHSDVEPPFLPIAQDQDSVSVGSPDVGLLVSPLVDISTDSVSAVIRPLSQLPNVDNLFAQDRLWAPIAVPLPAIVARPQYLGGGWLGRARSWRSDLLSRSVHWDLVALSGIRRTAVRTTTHLLGSLDCPCIIRGSLSGSGFRSPPAFWKWAPVGGWVICHVMRRLLLPYNYNGMLVSCRQTLTFWTNIRWRCRDGVETNRVVSGGTAVSGGRSSCGCSRSSRTTCFRTSGRRG